ncbi:MAG: nucleotidyl transferase AbiEii/AbiGii toxin family protein [Desulfovibrio sp.]|jgi:predicted nucleotidyltransferase component of viral defense system|nr:nucleotidyl transferase AbiEii/AbiGii toxin family protein [Desulfovibrio sp.]
MIPIQYLDEWSETTAPWPYRYQVEQDLIISRILCDLYQDDFLREKTAIHGATAINRLLYQKPYRYSEDIDLVQVYAERIGPVMDRIDDIVPPWLGKYSYDHTKYSVHLFFKFFPETSTDEEPVRRKLKLEISMRDHGCIRGYQMYPYSVRNGWYSGDAEILSYTQEEMLASKFGALFKRGKQRDLYDTAYALEHIALDIDAIISCCFELGKKAEAQTGVKFHLTRANAEEIMLGKLKKDLLGPVPATLPLGIRFDEEEALRAFEVIWWGLVVKFPGSPWALTEKVLDGLRKSRPGFLEKAQSVDVMEG